MNLEYLIKETEVRYKFLYQNGGGSPSWFPSVWEIMKLLEIFL